MANTHDVNGESETSRSLPRIDLKNADTVQQGLAGSLNWAEENAKLIVALIVIAILAGAGYVGLQFVNRRQEQAAQNAYYPVEAKFNKIFEGFERARFRSLMPTAAEADSKDQAASGDLQKDYGTTLNELETVAREHAGTSAGAQAAILAGQTYLSYRQHDKAADLARLAAEKTKTGHTLQHLGEVLLGSALAEKGDCQGAVTTWQKILNSSSAAYLHADVSVRTGLCLERMGESDRAKEMYRKAAETESAAATTARGLLRALEVKDKKGVTETKG